MPTERAAASMEMNLVAGTAGLEALTTILNRSFGGDLLFKQLKPTIVLSPTNSTKHPSGGPQAYIQYVRHLENSANSTPTNQSSTNSGAAGTSIPDPNNPTGMNNYMDWLQAPLQPLMDDLGSATYEVFEKDPVKYRLYEEAVFQALNDRPEGVVT